MAGQLHIVHQSVWEGIAIVVADEEKRRSLHFGSHLQQSAMLLDDPDTLVLNYTRQMMAVLLFHAAPRRGLMIGLGGGSIPRFLLRHFPELVMDVVEISPQVVEVARGFFLLPQDRRLRIHLAEGGRFLAGAPSAMGKYDLLMVDAFDDKGMAASVQAGLFFQHCHGRLAEGGVMVLNMTCGTHPARCRGLTEAMGEVFGGEVLRFAVDGTNNQILFGFSQALTRARWQEMAGRGQGLEARTLLPYGQYLKRLQQENAVLLRKRHIHP